MCLLLVGLLVLFVTTVSTAVMPASHKPALRADTSYLPYYSCMLLSGTIVFLTIFLYSNVCNFFKYVRYGVFSANDFYTPQDTLKVGSLLLCLLGGQLLFVGLLSFFYTNTLTVVNGINPAVNTGFLSLVFFVFLVVN